ncbi:hypothetical protein TNCV_372161 [Trichonephila clavipes]|nr:hypothetical protein TNCV_372161 [Trichonephila clavipes]
MVLYLYDLPAGWCSWFVAGPLYPRLRVPPRPKSVDFPDAENRHRPRRMIIRHERYPLSVHLAWMLLAKLNALVKFRVGRAQVPSSGEEIGRQNYLR